MTILLIFYIRGLFKAHRQANANKKSKKNAVPSGRDRMRRYLFTLSVIVGLATFWATNGCHPIARFFQNTPRYPDEVLTFPPVDAQILGTATPEIHDRYFAIGPDGRKYRTWHPLTVPVDPAKPDGPRVTFGHDHGDPPHPDAPLPCFGYIAFHSGQPDMVRAHEEYKVFTHKRGQRSGWDTPETPPLALDWDIQFWIHQGYYNVMDVQQYRSAGFWAKDPVGSQTEVYYLAENDPLDRPVADLLLQKYAADAMAAVSADTGYEIRSFAGNIANRWDCPVRAVVRSAAEHPAAARFTDRRMLLGANWEWLNENGPETFYTDVRGNLLPDSLAGQIGVLRQRVAPVRVYSAGEMTIDRRHHYPWVGMETHGIERLMRLN